MPDRNRDIFGYASVFKRSSPRILMQFLFAIALGLFVGILSFVISHAHFIGRMDIPILLHAAFSGILIITVPAMLTVAFIKMGGRKRVRLKHIGLVALVFSMIYSVFVILGAIVALFTNSYYLADVVILVGNSLIFGYWILADKVIVGLNKSASIAATLQPFFNAIFYVTFGGFVIMLGMPQQLFFLKLVVGMFVFLIFSYFFIYVLDKPMKEALNISTMKTFTIMVNQWLYDIGSVDMFSQQSFGILKTVEMDILIIKGNGRYKAIFVNPNIHYGPFKNVGGSIAPEALGSMIQKKYAATPFIVHGAVNASDNPVSASQIFSIAAQIGQYMDRLKDKDFSKARGSVSIGRSKLCRAIDVKVDDFNLFMLTKAPMVVEDIEQQAGAEFRSVASKGGKRKVTIIDAHNSRFESARPSELEGIKHGSEYEAKYKEAIVDAMKKEKSSRLRCGFACQKIYYWLKHPEDIGRGYTSVGIFETEGKKFCMVYFDSNNMLPGFRREMIDHIKSRFKMDSEILTTDTHSVNGLNLPVNNVLGRDTSAKDVKPIIDVLIKRALNDIGPIEAHSGKMQIGNFRVWGPNAEKVITSVARDIVKKTWRYIPIVTFAGSIVASLIIYLA